MTFSIKDLVTFTEEILIGKTSFLCSVQGNIFFFLSGFSFKDTGDSQDSRGREGTSFIPFYHFLLITNIQTFICNFAYEMTTTYF